MVTLSDGKTVSEREIFEKVIKTDIGAQCPALCKFSLGLLGKIPSYFWSEPASFSETNHPEFAHGDGGLARHSLMTYLWLKMLLESNSEDMREFIPGMVVASLFHDCCKMGVDGVSSGNVLFEHPLLSAKLVLDQAEEFSSCNKELFEMSIEDEDAFKNNIAVAVSCIETHMGRWNTSDRSKVVLPLPKTSIQFMVHVADYCASRRCTTFDSKAFSDL